MLLCGTTMYPKRALTAYACVGVLFTCLPATAQVGPPDQRRDWYELQPREEELRRYAEADCIAATNADLTRIDANTFELSTRGWNEEVPNPGTSICPGTRFYGQQTGGRGSAVLVGPNKVLAAEHNFPEAHCKAKSFVFDYFQQGPNVPPVDPAGTPRGTLVPASNVYKCIAWTSVPNLDLVVLTLDRDVENGRRPLKINRDSGTLEPGTPVVTLGHPQSLPMKIEPGTVVSHTSANARIRSLIHAARRSSGSMLVDRTRGVVAGIVASGPNLTACNSLCCTDNPLWFDSPPSSINVALGADYVPQLGLSVTPATGLVEMYGPIWGNFTNWFTEYTISTSPDERGNVAYEVHLDQDSGLFTLDHSNAPISGVLAPGKSRTFRVGTVLLRGFYPTGVHTATLRVVDKTYGSADFRKHRLSVGTDGFFVDPEEGFYGAGPGATSGETTEYTINSRYLGTQEIRISTSDSWLYVNSMNTPFAVNVSGVNGGGTESVRVSVDDTGLRNGVHRGQVTFDSHPFDGTFAVTRDVLIDVGREIYTTPGPINIGTGLIVPIILPSGVRFQDIDVEVDMLYENDPTPILVELISPFIVHRERIRLRLYENGSARRARVNEIFDDLTNPLQTGDSLSSLENIAFQSGAWGLYISGGDSLPLEGNGTLNRASLRVTRARRPLR